MKFNEIGNVFLGNNGVGKTNILEGIHCLALGKSQRSAKDYDMMKIYEDFYHISGQGILRNGADIEIDIIYEGKSKKKTLKINESTQKSLSNLIGKIGLVSFSPEDTIITTGSPIFRRRFLDITLSQVSRAYLKNLQDYHEILTQRNSLLKNLSRKGQIRKKIDGELYIWTEKLVEVGAKITNRRFVGITEIAKKSNPIYKKITGGVESFSVNYLPSIKFDFESVSIEKIKQNFIKVLENSIQQESKLGYTLSGPQRDDIAFYINGQNIKNYGSQGQHRSICIALRLAEAQILSEKMGEKPIILLDDVFSELDMLRTNVLMDMFSQFGQVFLATPRREDLEKCPESFTIFRIEKNCKIANI